MLVMYNGQFESLCQIAKPLLSALDKLESELVKLTARVDEIPAAMNKIQRRNVPTAAERRTVENHMAHNTDGRQLTTTYVYKSVCQRVAKSAR